MAQTFKYPVKACANFGDEINVYYYPGGETMRRVVVSSGDIGMPPVGSTSFVTVTSTGEFVKLESETSKLAGSPSMLLTLIQYLIQIFNMLNPFQSVSAYAQGGIYLVVNDQYYLQGPGKCPGTWSAIELTQNRICEIKIDGKGFYINHWVAYVYILLFGIANQFNQPHFGKLRIKPFGDLEFTHGVQLLAQYCNGLMSRNLSEVDFSLVARCVSDMNDSASLVRLLRMVMTILQRDAVTADQKGKAKGVLIELCKELNLNKPSSGIDFTSLVEEFKE